MSPFAPKKHSTTAFSVSSTTQSAQLSPSPGPMAVRIVNEGTATVWVAFGNAGVQANITDCVRIPAGVTEVLTAMSDDTTALYVSVIAAGATGAISFTPGEGI